MILVRLMETLSPGLAQATKAYIHVGGEGSVLGAYMPTLFCSVMQTILNGVRVHSNACKQQSEIRVYLLCALSTTVTRVLSAPRIQCCTRTLRSSSVLCSTDLAVSVWGLLAQAVHA